MSSGMVAEKKSVWRLRRQMLEDAPDVGQEAHVAHAVGLVQHQHFDAGEVDLAIADQVEQAARTGDDDLGAAAQRFDLGRLAHAAIDGDAAHLHALAQRDARLGDLFGQLARGRHDQHAHLAQRTFGQPLQDGQHEGRGLAGAGLSQAQHIAPLQDDGNGLLLDGRGRGIAHCLDARANARIEGKLFKIH